MSTIDKGEEIPLWKHFMHPKVVSYAKFQTRNMIVLHIGTTSIQALRNHSKFMKEQQ